jgi:hypothetical protein
MHQQGKYVLLVHDLMLCQLIMDYTMKTLTRPPLETTGNFFWLCLWLYFQALVRGSIISDFLPFSLFSICVFMFNVQTIGRHLSWFPPGREDGGPPLLDMDIQGFQLFWFILIWKNNWQTKDMCFFLLMI